MREGIASQTGIVVMQQRLIILGADTRCTAYQASHWGMVPSAMADMKKTSCCPCVAALPDAEQPLMQSLSVYREIRAGDADAPDQ